MTAKDGSKWKAILRLDDKKKLLVESVEKRKPIGKCPICGNDVLIGKNNYYCSDPGCDFSLSKMIKGGRIAEKDAAAMLAHRKTQQIKFTWSSGKAGQARLYLQGAKLCWEFS